MPINGGSYFPRHHFLSPRSLPRTPSPITAIAVVAASDRARRAAQSSLPKRPQLYAEVPDAEPRLPCFYDWKQTTGTPPRRRRRPAAAPLRRDSLLPFLNCALPRENEWFENLKEQDLKTSIGSSKWEKGTIGCAFGSFVLHVAVNVAVFYFRKQSTLVPRRTGYAVAGSYIILRVIFLGAVVCVLFSIYKPMTAALASELARSTEDAGGNIVAQTSDESKKSDIGAAICSRVQTGSSWMRMTGLISAGFGFLGWTDTFELDVSALWQPIGPVTEQVSWVRYVGRPMKQTDNATCALVACTVAVEAMNRYVHALSYGKGKPFPRAAAKPHELQKTCLKEEIWNQSTGASVRRVLEVIQKLGGVPDARKKGTLLPLTGWKEYSADNGFNLTEDDVAKLLTGGPCVGTLWVCPWYHIFVAIRKKAWVYRGCGKSQENRHMSKLLYGEDVSHHAVVCLGYRRCGNQVHVLVLDNHTANGPRRWVNAQEIDGIYTLTV